MKERKLNIEFMRIVAILSTIVIHVSNIYIRSFGKISNGAFFTGAFFNACARICVPIFFMISGALLIPGEYKKEKYLKRIRKFVIILAVWSVIYFLINVYRGGDANVVKAIARTFFDTTYTSKHLWFMYAIIGIYICLPFVQSMCKNLTKEQENLFLILWLGLCGMSVIYLPLARALGGRNIDIEYPIPIINAAYYLGYFVSGHILYQRLNKVKANKKYNFWCVFTLFVTIALITIVTYIASVKYGKLVNGMLWYRSIFIILESFALFILIITNEDKFKDKWIGDVASLSFGVYLVHAIILFIIKDNIDMISYPPIVFIPVFSIIIFVASLLIAFIMKKIPVIKNLIG